MNWVLDEYNRGRRNFSYCDLSGLRLADCCLTEAKWCGADFSDCHLVDVDISEGDFKRAKFNGASLRKITAYNTVFKRTNFHRAAITTSDLSCSSFYGADLCETKIKDSQFGMCNFNHANLIDSEWNRANIFDCSFRWVSINHATFLTGTIRNCDFRGSRLDEIQVPWSIVSGCKLDGTCFDQTKPLNLPKPGVFDELEPGWLIGYRPETSMFASRYSPGQLRDAHHISTSPEQSHPGIYVNPTIDDAMLWRQSQPYHPSKHRLVSVIFRPWECHVAQGPAYRVRWCIVWDYV